jgi:SAM-dependent methyltransferase
MFEATTAKMIRLWNRNHRALATEKIHGRPFRLPYLERSAHACAIENGALRLMPIFRTNEEFAGFRMGRFASTAALYEELRPPYLPEFFGTVAKRLSLSKQHALIDLGTGPGLLALGFVPYVGRIVGVDPEPAMIAAAKRAAARASQAFTLIKEKAEALSDDIGSFDVVTIGRALHWMERDATLALWSGWWHAKA